MDTSKSKQSYGISFKMDGDISKPFDYSFISIDRTHSYKNQLPMWLFAITNSVEVTGQYLDPHTNPRRKTLRARLDVGGGYGTATGMSTRSFSGGYLNRSWKI
jgi:hypothetical protein